MASPLPGAFSEEREGLSFLLVGADYSLYRRGSPRATAQPPDAPFPQVSTTTPSGFI